MTERSLPRRPDVTGPRQPFAKRIASRFTRTKSFAEPPIWSYDNLPWGNAARPDRESIENDFASYVADAYKGSGVVFACMLARMMLFSEARFQWQRMRNGRPGDLFASPELQLLETPWPNGTTGDLLARMITDADAAGNFYATTVDNDGNVGRAATGPGRRLARLRPDWVQIILGSKSGKPYAIDTRTVAYRYAPPSGDGGRAEPVLLLPSEVVHFAPVPDPLAQFRGMSWLTPVLREVMADKAASKHKLKFFEHGATLGTIITLDKDVDPEAFDEFVERFRAQHEGVDTAYKTLTIGGGADATVVGATMQQLDFKSTQGAGETRIAAAAGMHPVIVGLSEGLQGSSLNAGNFDAAKRLTGDKTLRPLWRQAAAAFGSLLTSPGSDARLWYDDRDIAFLRDDTTDVAEIQSKQAVTARQLTDAGYTPESVIDYLTTGDLARLKHSGLFSVQLQAPGSGLPTIPTPPGADEE